MRFVATLSLFTIIAVFVVTRLNPTLEKTRPQVLPQAIANAPEQVLALERYIDQDYGFSMAIPAGWSKIVSDMSSTTDVGSSLYEVLEPGYAVGFQTPSSGNQDRFSDYILIELLPGDEFAMFDATEEQQYYFRSEKKQFDYHRLSIDSKLDDNIDVDLIIFQRGVQAFGYTLAFYAIGEPANEKLLFEAFQIMLRTFEQIDEPFVII